MEQTIVIKTEFGCPVIYRRIMRNGMEVLERAANMRQLAADALAAIHEQGSTRWIDGEYTCPGELAERAQWHEMELRSLAA